MLKRGLVRCSIIKIENGLKRNNEKEKNMPKEAPEWEICHEAEEIVKGLREMYPEVLGHVDASMVGCAMIVNNPSPKSQKWDSRIKGIREPESLFTSKLYVIYFYKDQWEKYTKIQREYMLLRQLGRIGDDFDGAVLPESLKDDRMLVKKFGVDYMENPNLPDLLSEKQILQ